MLYEVIRVMIGALIILVSISVNALVIDFEDQAVTYGSANTVDDLVSYGFFFDEGPVARSNRWDHLHAGYLSHWADNGTINITNHNDITFSDGSLFSLNSIDLGEFHPDPIVVTVFGHYSGGSIISTILTLDGSFDGEGGVDDFETFFFGSAWSNLTSVYMTSDDIWSLDNVVVNDTISVPEPSTTTLLLLGSLGLSIFRMKFNKASNR